MGKGAVMYGERLWTEAEWAEAPQHERGGYVELIDGELVVTPAPGWGHQSVAGRVFVELTMWARQRPEAWSVGIAPFGIRVGPGRILEPDVFVLPGRLPADVRPQDVPLPALVVEVVSPTGRVFDRVTKRALYAEAGIEAYWVLDPQRRIAEMWLGPGLTPVGVVQELTVPGFEGLTVDASSLWG